MNSKNWISVLLAALVAILVPHTAWAQAPSASAPIPMDLEFKDKASCEAAVVATAADRDATKAQLAALQARCDAVPAAAPAPAPTPPPKKAPPKQTAPAKPECEFGSVFNAATKECECPDEVLHWPGDEPGVTVRIQRSAVPASKNGRPVIGCVATRASEVALFNEVDRRIKAACNVQPTVDALTPPAPERADLYPDKSDEDCETLRAYLHELMERKRALDGAVDKDGKPAPLTVVNWLIVWNRILDVIVTLEDHEKRIKHLEDTTCQKNADGTFNANCPDFDSLSTVTTGIGPAFLAVLRGPGAPPTFAIGGEMSLTFWLGDEKKNGIHIPVIVGYGANVWSKRLVVAPGLRYMRALDDARKFRLHMGGIGIFEPNDSDNHASTFAAHLGLRMVFGNFFVDPQAGFGAGKSVIHRKNAAGQYRAVRLSKWAPVGELGLSLGFEYPGTN